MAYTRPHFKFAETYLFISAPVAIDFFQAPDIHPKLVTGRFQGGQGWPRSLSENSGPYCGPNEVHDKAY